MMLAAFGTLFICGGIQGYQAFVGDLRKTGALEWPLRVLLVIGGFVIATPGGGIMPISQLQITGLGLAILVPTVLIALLLMRRKRSRAEPATACLMRDQTADRQTASVTGCMSMAKVSRNFDVMM